MTTGLSPNRGTWERTTTPRGDAARTPTKGGRGEAPAAATRCDSPRGPGGPRREFVDDGRLEVNFRPVENTSLVGRLDEISQPFGDFLLSSGVQPCLPLALGKLLEPLCLRVEIFEETVWLAPAIDSQSLILLINVQHKRIV